MVGEFRRLRVAVQRLSGPSRSTLQATWWLPAMASSARCCTTRSGRSASVAPTEPCDGCSATSGRRSGPRTTRTRWRSMVPATRSSSATATKARASLHAQKYAGTNGALLWDGAGSSWNYAAVATDPWGNPRWPVRPAMVQARRQRRVDGMECELVTVGCDRLAAGRRACCRYRPECRHVAGTDGHARRQSASGVRQPRAERVAGAERLPGAALAVGLAGAGVAFGRHDVHRTHRCAALRDDLGSYGLASTATRLRRACLRVDGR